MGFTVTDAQCSAKVRRALTHSEILTVDGQPLLDVVDLTYFMSKDKVRVVYRDKRGREGSLNMPGEELGGLAFDRPLLPPPRECVNRCVFCFVHQLARGMRSTLYVRDDDWRHSLLFGNFVTMTNVDEGELARIIERKASPLYISVHAACEEARRRLLGNRDAPPIRPMLERLAKGGISFHAQVVMAPGYNDGETLYDTVEYLAGLYPACRSLAVVPVGLTRHRAHLPDVLPVDEGLAARTVKVLEAYGDQYLAELKTRFVYASDEMYIKAGMPLPSLEFYEELPQLENGVGLVAKLYDDVDAAVDSLDGYEVTHKRVSVATGKDAYRYVRDIADSLEGRFGVDIAVYAVNNDFFGPQVTVAGLLTGRDIYETLKGRDLGELLILSGSMLREGVFLDDMTLGELSQSLNVKICAQGIESLPFIGRME